MRESPQLMFLRCTYDGSGGRASQWVGLMNAKQAPTRPRAADRMYRTYSTTAYDYGILIFPIIDLYTRQDNVSESNSRYRDGDVAHTHPCVCL